MVLADKKQGKFFVLGDTDLGTDLYTFSVDVEKCSGTDGDGDATLYNR